MSDIKCAPPYNLGNEDVPYRNSVSETYIRRNKIDEVQVGMPTTLYLMRKSLNSEAMLTVWWFLKGEKYKG